MQDGSELESDSSDDTLPVSPAKRREVRQPPDQSAKQTTTVDVSEHFDTVIKGVSHNWDGLAEKLKVSWNDIEGLRHDLNYPDHGRKCRQVLWRWKNKHGRRATLQDLQDALHGINEGETAEKLDGGGAGPSSTGQDEGSSGEIIADLPQAGSSRDSESPSDGGDNVTERADQSETEMGMTETPDVLYEATPKLVGGPPLLPVAVDITTQVLPSVKTPEDFLVFASALDTLSTVTESGPDTLTNCILGQIKTRTKNITDLKKVMEAIERLEKFKDTKVIYVKKGSLIFYLRCADMSGLGDIWFMYKSGELNNLLQSILISEETLEQLCDESVSVKTAINIADFRKVLVYLLTSPATKGRPTPRLPQEYPLYQPHTHPISTVLDVLHLDATNLARSSGKQQELRIPAFTKTKASQEHLETKPAKLKITGTGLGESVIFRRGVNMAAMSRHDLYLEISRNLLDREGRDLRKYTSGRKLLPARDLQHMDPQEIFTALEQEGKLQVGDLSLLVQLMTKIGRVDFANKAKRIAAQETKASKMQRKSDRASDSSDDTFRASPAKGPRVRQPPGRRAKQTTVDVSEHFGTVIKGVSNKWDDLAEALGFTDNEIKGLRHDQYLYDQDKKCREVLHKWMNKHGRKATLQVLCEALIDINEGKTADKLKEAAEPSSTIGEGSSGGSTAGRPTVRHQERAAEPGAGGDAESLTDEGDGKIDVKVETCDEGFWERTMNEKNPYKMDSKPRGHALILNNAKFTKLRYRRGAGVDLSNIKDLLEGLSFETHVLEDKTAKEIEEEVRAFSQRKEHRHVDSCVVVLMSHGDEGVIYGTDDRTVQLDRIFAMFDNEKCLRLKGKPKLFFIQACRGQNIYKGEDQTDSAAAEGDLDVKVDLKSELERLLFTDETDGPGGTSTSTRADMFCGYATQLGYQAIRNTENGSWFIQDITKVFMKNAKNTSLIDMMDMVKKDVSNRKASFGGKQEADFLSTLQKPLYFFPGED